MSEGLVDGRNRGRKGGHEDIDNENENDDNEVQDVSAS